MSTTRMYGLLSAAIGGVLATGSAWAQAATSTQGSGTLEEVVVTAQKEALSLQETPAAVTAVAGDWLVEAGVTDLPGTQMFVPAVRFQKEGNTIQVFVRGVGSGLDLAPIEPTVAFNFNGVYVPREGTSTSLYDIASLEVLPGPQGTLYGRSAIGGAVNVAFNRPSHDSRGRALLEAGNFSLVHGSIAQNLPMTDRLALRVAADYVNRDGYNGSGADSQDDAAARVSLLYDPNEDVSVYFWTYGAQKNGHPANLVNKGTDPVTFTYSPDAFLTSDPWDDRRLGPLEPLAPFGQPSAGDQTYDNFGVGGELDWDLGDLRLTYVPGYIYLDSASDYWLGGIPAFISQRYNQWSQELRLASDGDGPLRWLGGVYAYNQRNTGLFTVAGIFVNSDVRSNLIKGTGVFGQGTYSVSDTFRLTAGARYSSDKREADGYQTANPATLEPILPFTFEHTYSNVDWKLGAEYDIAPEVMLYATLQTGSSPGTYNSAPATPTFDNAVRPANLTALSAGVKSRLAGDTLQINVEGFHYAYRDLIIQQYNQDVVFNPVFNAQKIKIYGAQADLLWKPTRDDQFNLNASFTHARNEEFTTPAGDNYNGLQPPYAPDWTLLAGYEHGFELAAGLLRARLDARYESSWWADYVHNPGTQQGSSIKVDASLTYESGDRWSLGAWARNLGNEAVLAATAAGGLPGPATCYLEAPRTFGLRFTVNY